MRPVELEWWCDGVPVGLVRLTPSPAGVVLPTPDGAGPLYVGWVGGRLWWRADDGEGWLDEGPGRWGSWELRRRRPGVLIDAAAGVWAWVGAVPVAVCFTVGLAGVLAGGAPAPVAPAPDRTVMVQDPEALRERLEEIARRFPHKVVPVMDPARVAARKERRERKRDKQTEPPPPSEPAPQVPDAGEMPRRDRERRDRGALSLTIHGDHAGLIGGTMGRVPTHRGGVDGFVVGDVGGESAGLVGGAMSQGSGGSRGGNARRTASGDTGTPKVAGGASTPPKGDGVALPPEEQQARARVCTDARKGADATFFVDAVAVRRQDLVAACTRGDLAAPLGLRWSAIRAAMRA